MVDSLATVLLQNVGQTLIKHCDTQSPEDIKTATSLAFTGESIAIIDRIVHGKFKISAATHEYCKCFDGFVS